MPSEFLLNEKYSRKTPQSRLQKNLLKIINSKLRTYIFLVFIFLSFTIVSSQIAFAFHTQYTLPLPSPLQHEPSYAIRIPFGASDENMFSNYNPQKISIPAGMTVVWFNDDTKSHTVTTKLSDGGIVGNTSNVKINSPPEQFDSGIIPPGGFAVFTFTKPGTYNYYDNLNPSNQGQITVGGLIAIGKHMDMRIGGSIPVNFTQLERIVLSFVPKTISLPPPLELIYNVSISNSTDIIYNHQFSDIDGILDLEIIPISKTVSPAQIHQGSNMNNIITFTTYSSNNTAKNTTHNANNIEVNLTNQSIQSSNDTNIPLTIRTTTYGPDISAPITGVYHIEGPILVDPSPHTIRVEVVSHDISYPANAIEDEFMLPNKLGIP